MKTSIFLNSLAVHTFIGINPNEKINKQTIFIDLTLNYKTENAIKTVHSDDINDAIDYDSVAKHIVDFANKNYFDMVESLAYRLAQSVFKKFKVDGIKIKISKKGLIENCESYGCKSKFKKSDFAIKNT